MQDFHLHYRYSYRHSHLHALHHSLRYGFDAACNALLPTFACAKSRCFGIQLIPDHLRRYSARPVSYYALFKWWLLLSQHPGCLGSSTSFRTEQDSGTLAGDLGCSPLDYGAYPPPSSCHALQHGIRSLVRKGSRVGPLSDSVALPPCPTSVTLTLKLFRRERAISTFDDTFNPPHSSSPSFSTLVSSVLHWVLPQLQPGHA